MLVERIVDAADPARPYSFAAGAVSAMSQPR